MSVRPWLVSALVVLLAGVEGCSCANKFVCSIPDINDPSKRTLRRDILAKGLDQFCPQMKVHDAPLKLQSDAPIIGRFYPRNCSQRTLDNGDLWVQFDGEGYGYQSISKKVSFNASVTVTYNPDFRCASDDSMYAYFTVREGSFTQPSFAVNKIEVGAALPGMANFITGFANNFGNTMLQGKLKEGFTVIHDTDDNNLFDLGIIPLGQRPFAPFNVHGSGRINYENNRVEVHQNQRDFIGPINVEDAGRALYLTMQLDGIQAVDVFVMGQTEAEQALRWYLDGPQVTPLPFPPSVSDVVQQGTEYRRALPISQGIHYVVIDNTALAGQVAPPTNLFDDRAAVLNYLIQIGDAP